MNDFIANLYELWGTLNLQNFSNDMYQNGYYQPIFIVMVGSCLIVPFIYYYLINHPRLNRWYHWLLFNIGTALINFFAAWNIAQDKIIDYYAQQGMEVPYGSSNYFILAIVVSFWAFIFFLIFSFVMKWWSRNAKHSPFI